LAVEQDAPASEDLPGPDVSSIMAAEPEEDGVGILRPYDLQYRFFPPQTRIELSVEFFTSFANIQRAKYLPRPAPGQNVSLRPDITPLRQ
jgi:hypothetical protein